MQYIVASAHQFLAFHAVKPFLHNFGILNPKVSLRIRPSLPKPILIFGVNKCKVALQDIIVITAIIGQTFGYEEEAF